MAETKDQNIETYTASPNQIVYDQEHQMDFEVNVTSIYFAERKPKLIWEAKTEAYTVKNGGKPTDVKAKYVADNRRNITADVADNLSLTPQQIVTVSWEEEVQEKDAQGNPAFEYIKLEKAKIKDKVFIVANCNGTNGKLTIEINENKLTNEELVYENPIKFLIGEDERTKIEFTINNTFIYAQEITLRPKSDEDLKSLAEKFEKREKKNAFLFFKANVTDTEDEIKYANELQEYLNENESQFEIKYCGCIEYKIENNLLSGPNVITSKTGSLVSGHNGIETIKAIILHRTAGSSTSGAVAHTKGTHFYVDRGTNDGEIFQAVTLDKYTNHIMNQTARIANLEIQTENSIGIEVVGMAYEYKDNELYNIYGTKINDPANTPISKGFTSGNKTYYWDVLTENQIKSVKCLVMVLMEKYKLKTTDIYTHEEIQSKTAGEGSVVKSAIINLLNECL